MTTLAQCGDIKGGGLSVATTDVTNQDSTNGEKEEKPTVITNQKITTTCVFDPGNATQNATAGVMYLARNRLRRKFQVFSTTRPTPSRQRSTVHHQGRAGFAVRRPRHA